VLICVCSADGWNGAGRRGGGRYDEAVGDDRAADAGRRNLSHEVSEVKSKLPSQVNISKSDFSKVKVLKLLKCFISQALRLNKM
jgi:hypothetical protein